MLRNESPEPARRLRAPTRHGEALCDPPLATASDVLRTNRQLLQVAESHDVHGQSLHDLRREARAEIARLAGAYTSAYRDVSAPCDLHGASPIIMSGHQPELVHPGVLFKHFALHQLAQDLRAVPIHVLIDHDMQREPALHVPAGTPAQPQVTTVPYDQTAPALPHENRLILDPQRFTAFGEQIRRGVQPWIRDPLIETMWPAAQAACQRGARLGQALAEARHVLEQHWGLQTYEVPMSHLCDTDAFRRFAAHLLGRLPIVHHEYNEALRSYRSANSLRSRSHPVPDLAEQDGWREAPFWIWSSSDPQRRPLFVQTRSGQVRLRAGGAESPNEHGRVPATVCEQTLSLSETGDASSAVAQLRDWRVRDGVILRPRAIVTTMYLRLVLSDLFLHGIGGAKYDEITDQLMARLFGCPGPRFVTLSATFRLPLTANPVGPDELRSAGHQLRDLWYHPERHLDGVAVPTEVAGPLLAQKREWIQAPAAASREEASVRHEAMQAINSQLRAWVAPQRQQMLEQLQELTDQARTDRQLTSREFSFCLFSSRLLPTALQRLATG